MGVARQLQYTLHGGGGIRSRHERGMVFTKSIAQSPLPKNI